MPKTIKDVEKVAEERGWCLNPDSKQVNNLIKAQNLLHEKFGDYYCPCKVKKIPENVCPCEGSTAEMEKDGHCHCQLYYKCEDQN
jgi:ferredoxin-thioredoxin reductase catalytic chain